MICQRSDCPGLKCQGKGDGCPIPPIIKRIADQAKSSEMFEPEHADFVGAYDSIIEEARDELRKIRSR